MSRKEISLGSLIRPVNLFASLTRAPQGKEEMFRIRQYFTAVKRRRSSVCEREEREEIIGSVMDLTPETDSHSNSMESRLAARIDRLRLYWAFAREMISS